MLSCQKVQCVILTPDFLPSNLAFTLYFKFYFVKDAIHISMRFKDHHSFLLITF